MLRKGRGLGSLLVLSVLVRVGNLIVSRRWF